MEFALHFPAPPLDAHVESMSFFSGVLPRHQREKLIPDGAIEIIVDLTERPKKLFASETGPVATDFRKAWISGMRGRPIVIEAQPQASMLVIRFRPGGAFAFLGHDAEALSDGVFALDDVFGASSLRDRTLGANSIAGKFAAAEGWLLERATDGLVRHPAVGWLVRRLKHPAGLRIADLADEAGYSERQMQTLFRKWVGMTPKHFARLRRFQAVLDGLAETGRPHIWLEGEGLPRADWAAVAQTAGYADQSHLSHEFQAFAGMTPGSYLAAYRGLSNYLPITLPESAISDFYKTAAAVG